jgi:hypothetical protein
MKFHMRILSALLICGLVLAGSAIFAATTPTVQDLTKSYEIWKNQGIKLVVRDGAGNIIDHGFGRLESWGSVSKWVVRNKKGHFLTHAFGKIESWKNGKTRLVLRSPKGWIMTHIDINLTDKASFAHNVVGLRKLKGDSKFIGFVQETLGELIVTDLKQKDTIKAKVLLDYIRKYKSQKTGMKNFVPVLRLVLRQLNFMAAQGDDSVIVSLAAAARDMLNELN